MTSAVRILGNIQLVYHTFYFNMTIRKLKLFPLIYFLILKSKISICNIFSIFSIIIRKTFYEDEIFLKSYMEKRIATLCINKKKNNKRTHTHVGMIDVRWKWFMQQFVPLELMFQGKELKFIFVIKMFYFLFQHILSSGVNNLKSLANIFFLS